MANSLARIFFANYTAGNDICPDCFTGILGTSDIIFLYVFDI